ncbi:uncharacterized protein BDZ83DRAFT_729043 [Colletotrichum acutatum]|uniref:Uncharacterized protein n=1 Tax=Glomerella acutata TaxID=27357 RepID=A0AAD8UUA9_GLOAC|nr:uncharacterized protein BDZ83DRAFT_729043 [Colletotrichum acutatum]KAK1727239.1 hypothetical protein BDZ83DRAFT_729043 [Colletotrichum acutatum]
MDTISNQSVANGDLDISNTNERREEAKVLQNERIIWFLAGRDDPLFLLQQPTESVERQHVARRSAIRQVLKKLGDDKKSLDTILKGSLMIATGRPMHKASSFKTFDRDRPDESRCSYLSLTGCSSTRHPIFLSLYKERGTCGGYHRAEPTC